MKKKLLSVLLSLGLMVGLAPAIQTHAEAVPQSSWTTPIPMTPAGTGEFTYGYTNVNGLSSKDGNMYTAGGWAFGTVADIIKYNPTTNVFSKVASLPHTTQDPATVLVEENGKEYIYVFGGHSDGGTVGEVSELLNKAYKYDILTKTIETLPNLPVAFEDATASYAGNGEILVIGGAGASGNLNSVYKFNIATKTWSTGVPTTYTHSAHSAVTNGGKTYVIGGRGTGAGKVEMFDPTTNTWTQKANMPLPAHHHHGADVYNGEIYVSGGDNDGNYSSALNTLYVYNIASNTWSQSVNSAIGKGIDRHAFAFKKDMYGNKTNQAVIWFGWSDGYFYDTTTFTLDITAPDNVTNLVAGDVSLNEAVLSWTPSVSSDVSHYNIYNSNNTLIGSTSNTYYDVFNLADGTNYTFTVKSVDLEGNVSSGTSVSFTTEEAILYETDYVHFAYAGQGGNNFGLEIGLSPYNPIGTQYEISVYDQQSNNLLHREFVTQTEIGEVIYVETNADCVGAYKVKIIAYCPDYTTLTETHYIANSIPSPY